MRKSGGYGIWVDPDLRQPIERDTIACGHCNRAIFVKPGTASTVYLIWSRRASQWTEEAGAFCRVCMKPVCLLCHDKGSCTPFERWLEEKERP